MPTPLHPPLERCCPASPAEGDGEGSGQARPMGRCRSPRGFSTPAKGVQRDRRTGGRGLAAPGAGPGSCPAPRGPLPCTGRAPRPRCRHPGLLPAGSGGQAAPQLICGDPRRVPGVGTLVAGAGLAGGGLAVHAGSVAGDKEGQAGPCDAWHVPGSRWLWGKLPCCCASSPAALWLQLFAPSSARSRPLSAPEAAWSPAPALLCCKGALREIWSSGGDLQLADEEVCSTCRS